jgi:radical SAM-linked protein
MMNREDARPPSIHHSAFILHHFLGGFPGRSAAGKREPMVRQRVRIRFRKEGDLRLLGHRDLLRAWERLLRRSGLETRMSEGFHPRPKINFPSALSVGIAGTDEVLEVDLLGESTAGELHERLAQVAPAEMPIQSVELLPEGARPAQLASMSFELPVPGERWAVLQTRIAALLAADSCPLERDAGRQAVDVRPDIEHLELAQGQLRMRIRVTRQASIRPRDVLAVLQLEDLEQQGCYLTRTAVELQS